MIDYKEIPEVMRSAAELSIADIETQPVTLEEVFMAYYGRNNKKNRHNLEPAQSGQDGGSDG